MLMRCNNIFKLSLATNLKLKRWNAAIRMIESCHDQSSNTENCSEADFDFHGTNVGNERLLFLHLVCRSRAPLHVIEKIIELYPTSALMRDVNTGRYALHCAARNAASPEVIRAIYRANPAAALSLDEDGFTPLAGALMTADCSGKNVKKSSLAALIKLRPKMLLVEDSEGMNPLEAVLFADHCIIPPKVVSMLQDYTAKYVKNVDARRSKRRKHRQQGLKNIPRQTGMDDVAISKKQGRSSSNRRSLIVPVC